MSNFRLSNDHVATAGHIRAERVRNDATYTTKIETTEVDTRIDTVVADQAEVNQAVGQQLLQLDASQMKTDGSRGMTGSLVMNNNKIQSLAPAVVGNDAVNKNQLDTKADITSVYTKAQSDDLLIPYATKNSVYNKLESDDLYARKTVTYTKTEVDSGLTLKKNLTDRDNRIQNTSNQSSVTCDTNTRIRLTAAGQTLCDIEEDAVNQGATITTSRRLNLVSSQPQTQYHVSTSGQFNMKYNDNGSTTPGTAVFGQLQLAPSGRTDLNPCLTLSSARVNGLGTAASIFCDSTYGNTNTPLVIAPQSLTDQNATGLSMYRNNAVPTLKNQFRGKTGYETLQSTAESTEFLTKGLADQLYTPSGFVSGLTQEQADARYYKNDTPLNLITAPTGNLDLGNKKITGLLNGVLDTDVMNKGYIDGEVAFVQGQIDNLDTEKLDITTANTLYLKQNQDLVINGNVNLTATKKIQQSTAPVTGNDLTNKIYVDSIVSNALVPYTTTTDSDQRYYRSTSTLDTILQPTADLSLNNRKIISLATPTLNTDASTKGYVDQSISNAMAGFTGTSDRISVSNGNTVIALSDRVRFGTSTANTLEIIPQNPFLIYRQLFGSSQQFQIVDNSSVDYIWQYNVTQNNSRPQFRIIDKGDQGTQCTRLSSFRNNEGLPDSETYIQIEPMNSRLRVSHPIQMIGAYSTPTVDQQLVQKKYVDDQLAAVGSTLQVRKITSQDGRIAVECRNTPDVIISNSSGAGDSLVLNQNTIRVDNGQSLKFQVGSAEMEISTNNGRYIGINSRIQYANQQSILENLDQLMSKRLADQFYYTNQTSLNQIAIPAGNVNMNGFRISNLGDPFSNDQAVSRGWIYSQQCFSFELRLGEIPIANTGNLPSTSIVSRNGIITGVSMTRINTQEMTMTVAVDTGFFPDENYIVNLGFRSMRNMNAGTSVTIDNDIGNPTVYGLGAGVFGIYIEDRGGNLQNVAITGTIQRY